jgi:hypothetical protein
MLYNILVASLMTELKKPEHRELGMHIGDIWAGAQTWADDIMILAADEDLKTARKKMAALLMAVANTWAAENGVTFSTDATEGEGPWGKARVSPRWSPLAPAPRRGTSGHWARTRARSSTWAPPSMTSSRGMNTCSIESARGDPSYGR